MLVWFALLGFISILFFLLCSLGRGGLTPRLDLWVILAIFCLLGSAKRRPQKIGVQDGRSGILMLQLSQPGHSSDWLHPSATAPISFPQPFCSPSSHAILLGPSG